MSISSTATVEKPAPAKNGLLRRLGQVIFWFIVLCLFFEVGLRAFGYGRYVVFKPDQRLLWVPTPGKHLTVINHRPETINSQGFRYRETLTPEHKGTYRIFAFGDSVTMGWGVDDDSTYSAQLEKMLNSQGCPEKFQVISAGVNAYPEALVVERLKEVVEGDFHPDAVILGWSFNIGFEPLADLKGEDRQKFLRRVELKSIARRSAIYNFLIEDLLRDLVYYRLRSRIILGSWDTPAAPASPPVAHYLKELEEARNVAQAHHVPLIMILFGTKGQFAPVHPYQQAMLDFAHANHIPIVNMMDAMRSQNPDAMFTDDLVHPSAAGHVVIANQLAPVVRGLDSYAGSCPTTVVRNDIPGGREGK